MDVDVDMVRVKHLTNWLCMEEGMGWDGSVDTRYKLQHTQKKKKQNIIRFIFYKTND